MKKDLQDRIDEAMQSLKGLQSAEANTFLWSKIKNRMQESKELVPQGLAWRMVAALTLIAILNIITLHHFGAEKNSNKGLESVVNEYAISLPQTY